LRGFDRLAAGAGCKPPPNRLREQADFARLFKKIATASPVAAKILLPFFRKI